MLSTLLPMLSYEPTAFFPRSPTGGQELDHQCAVPLQKGLRVRNPGQDKVRVAGARVGVLDGR